MIVLENADGERYHLDDSFIISSLELEAPDAMQQAALQHGGKDSKRMLFQARDVEITGILHGSNLQDYTRKKDALVAFARSLDSRLYGEAPFARYLQLHRLTTFKEQFGRGMQWRVAQVNLTFNCEDPFWQDVNEITDSRTIASGGYFSFINPGNVESYPVVTVYSAFGALTSVELKNMSDDEQLVVYQDSGFVTANTVILNGLEGTVQRGSANTLRYMLGSFLRVVSGVNTFLYTGDNPIQLTTRFRPRYL
jgi:hypothetical protein